jgi:hypothetical protein
MVSNKRTTTPTHTQQSNLDWNVPQEPSTPASEYSFMENFEHVWGIALHSSFGPVDGGAVAQ